MPETQELIAAFERMGARAKIIDAKPTFSLTPPTTTLDVQHDSKGEYFELAVSAGDTLVPLAVEPDDRHLVVMLKNKHKPKNKFLCGHDERHWFVAAIPEKATVRSVADAKRALRPAPVAAAKNRARRQGEWFFVPVSDAERAVIDERRVSHNEPLRRGRSKPHMAEYLFRTGGSEVYVHPSYPNGINIERYQAIIGQARKTHDRSLGFGWRVMTAGAQVFVKGRISHPDHQTRLLRDWHRVYMNTENESLAMQAVRFLD